MTARRFVDRCLAESPGRHAPPRGQLALPLGTCTADA